MTYAVFGLSRKQEDEAQNYIIFDLRGFKLQSGEKTDIFMKVSIVSKKLENINVHDLTSIITLYGQKYMGLNIEFLCFSHARH